MVEVIHAVRAMYGFRAILICLLLVPAAYAQPVPAPVGEPTGAEGEVHATYKRFVEAWNKHDAAAMATLWTDEGDHTEPDGRTVHGRAEVNKLLQIEHASVFKGSQLHIAVEHVRLVSDDVAIADGTYELFGATDPAGNKLGVRAGYFTSVLKRDADGWKVSANRLMLPQVLIWRERE